MSNPDFITGIYNYCDYICEQCVFTRHCYLYWYENNSPDIRRAVDEADREVARKFGADQTYEDSLSLGLQSLAESTQEHDLLFQKRIAPAYEMIELLDPVVEDLTSREIHPPAVQAAIELVMANYLLISVKLYRALYNRTFHMEEHLSEREITAYTDTEYTLLAIIAFLWNLRHGLTQLQQWFPEYRTVLISAGNLARHIATKIDVEYLPITREILKLGVYPDNE